MFHYLFLGVVLFNLQQDVLSISCYSCTFNFNDIYDIQDGWCSNDTLYSMPKKEVVRPCAPWEIFCSTSVTTTLTSFTSITRGCSTHCPSLCDSEGYGAHQVTCSECCSKDLCNNDTSVQFYYKILNKQYTDWETPFAEELKFNKEHNLRFPY